MSLEENVVSRMLLTAQRLLEATLAGGVEWIETDDENVYLYVGSSASIEVSLHQSYNADDEYKFTLKNSRGTPVDSISTDMSRESEPLAEEIEDVLAALFDAARRRALGIDTLIDGLLNDIEEGYSGKSEPRSKSGRVVSSDPWSTARPASSPSFDDEPPF